MRDGAQTLLRDQFACLTAHSVCLVLNPDQGILQMLDELELTGCQLSGLLLGKSRGTLLKDLESGRCVGYVITICIVYIGPQRIIFFLSFGKLFKNNCLKLLKLLVAISVFLFLNSVS